MTGYYIGHGVLGINNVMQRIRRPPWDVTAKYYISFSCLCNNV